MTAVMDNETNAAKEAVFQFIADFHDAIVTQSEKRIEEFVGEFKLDFHTKYARYYIFGPIALPGGAIIQQGNVVSDGNRVEIFGNFEISGVCITREDVWQRYGKLPITGWPMPGIPMSKTYYTATFADSAIDFGFAEKNPDCLRSSAAGILNPPPYPFGKPD
ncbi:hypothetical protein [Andreprevotia chitinilytica]|uniref:hypothetical protein n=1 Tax=Andreprevotia chitinilytica TaxID=396808 RepID=UPI0005509D23|nr:hypothetical protein [Andreprevotia chitinilytica]